MRFSLFCFLIAALYRRSFLIRCICFSLLCFFALPLAGAQDKVALTAPPPKVPLPPALPHPVLDRIRAAHAMNCGVSKEEEDYSRATDHGNRAAFDIDLCKAVAVAVLGPGAKLLLQSYPDENYAVRALRTGEIDMLATATDSISNTAVDILFTRPVFYDGQGILTTNDPARRTPLDLAGKKVCFLTGSAAEEGLHAYAREHNITYIWYPFSEAGEMEAAFFTGNCDAVSGDVSQLANTRTIDPRRANDFKVLPQLIRQDPLATATLGGDVRFSAIVRWTMETLVAAESLGVTMGNAKSVATSTTRPEVQAVLGQRFGSGTALGLDPYWGVNVVAAVGNYGEIFDRDLGARSTLGLDRGENRLWTDGGLMYGLVPPIR